jgi:hypothetical protein
MKRVKIVRAGVLAANSSIWPDTFAIHGTFHAVSSSNIRCISIHR